MGLIELGGKIARNAWRLPVVGSLVEREYARAFFRGRGRYRGVYASFAEAEKTIPPGQAVGFDHETTAALYHDRMGKASASDYPVLYWLRRLLQPDSTVFDFGGHVGVSYHAWRAYLDYGTGLRWTVYDLPAITRAGELLARERPSAGLAFTNELQAARDATIFLAAGSLQFLERPLPALLDEAGARPRHILVSKLPAHDGEPFVTVQSAGGAFHPYQIVNRRAFVDGVTAKGYRLVDEWLNAEQYCKVPFTRDRDIDAYSGFYFARDDGS